MGKQRNAIRDHSFEANLFARRAFIAFIFVLALIAVLLSNLYHLQITSHNTYQTRSNENRIKVIPIAPNRGLIYDRNGVILAENRPVYNLEVVPEEVNDLSEALASVAALLNLSPETLSEFEKALKGQRRFKSHVLKARLDESEVALFSAHQHKFPGFSIEARLARYYPYGDTLTHALGYVARLNKKELAELERQERATNYQATRHIGKLGIEKFYEETLHGEVGYQEVEINNRGRIIRTLNATDPVPGQDIVLTLDIGLQQIAQHALGEQRGAAIVLDARDGGVLAMYSNPSYDPNLFVHGISSKSYRALLNPDRPLINRVTKGRYAPASTVKPHLAILGLEEGVVKEHTKIPDPGFFQIPNVEHKWRDWKRWGHGHVDVYKAIEESCDTYFYDIAYQMGIDPISTFMAKFGFGDLSGIDIHEEDAAILPSREWKERRFNQPWWRGDTISVGIGQGYWTATPIQIANSINVLVNRGVYRPPHLAMLAKKHNRIAMMNDTERPKVELKNERHWDIALKAMHNTVTKPTGTAHSIFVGTDYDSAGKTGTSQVISIAQDEEYDADKLKERFRDNGIYVGYAPYDNPEIVVTVVVENQGGGSATAAPIARKLMDYYFTANPIRLAGDAK